MVHAAKGRRPAKRQRKETNERAQVLLDLCQQMKAGNKDIPTFLADIAALFREIAKEEAEKRKKMKK